MARKQQSMETTRPPEGTAIAEIQPIAWTGDHLRLIDQTRLPLEYVVLDIADHRQAAEAIRQMRVRGAPAIGVTAAYAVALAAREIATTDREAFLHRLEDEAQLLLQARPTAVNLRWAVERMLAVARSTPANGDAVQTLVDEAVRIHQEDVEANRAIGRYGACLMPQSGGVLTHCNTGALATAGYGTALGVIRAAWEQGNRFHVFVTETRPFLQGARLTTWELAHLGIPATLIVDSAAGALLSRGEVRCVVVGADRIAANGDVANKIGTYTLAALAKTHGVPFYVAAPTSTVDPSVGSGKGIPIEERPPEEVTCWGGVQTASEGVAIWNPAFDVTASKYVDAIITQRGVAWSPYEASLRAMLENV